MFGFVSIMYMCHQKNMGSGQYYKNVYDQNIVLVSCQHILALLQSDLLLAERLSPIYF